MASKIASVFLGFMLFFSSLAIAAVSPTPQQIEQFKQLSVEQQKALAKQYGMNLDNLGLNGGSSSIPPPMVDVPTVSPRSTNARDTVLEQSISETDSAKKSPENVDGKTSKSEALEQFGYDLFAGTPSTFAPVTNIPIPAEYIIGPGDTIVVQLYGKENAVHELQVSRDGTLLFPQVGPLSVAGLTYNELRKYLTENVSQKMIGVNVSITMGTLRSIQVFVLGEAFRPGSYTVSSLSTMTNALFVSGGVTQIGSLRNVKLKRKGKVVGELDLYDLLLKGDTSADARLMPGDVIFIPPIGKTVGVAGEVRRPAIYEIVSERSVGDIVELAGGLLPTAYPKATRIDRIDERGDRTLVDVDASSVQGKALLTKDGDIINVVPVLDKVEGAVLVSGHVQRTGRIAWRPRMTVSDAIPSVNYLLPNPDLDYAVIKRENDLNRTIEVLTFNLWQAIINRHTSADIELMPKDEIFIFSKVKKDRKKLLKKLVVLLAKQASAGSVAQVASISGNVKFPGEYPVSKKMTAQELINAAGGLTESAYEVEAELIRVSLDKESKQVFNRLKLALGKLGVPGTVSLGIAIEPRDQVYIKKTPNWNEREYVEIIGEVNFPGVYPIFPGESIRSIVDRAGGLNERANPNGAIFLRESLKRREAEQIAKFKKLLETDLARMKVEAAQSKVLNPETDKLGAGLLSEISLAEATGRLVVDLPRILEGDLDSDIHLITGDKLVVPRKSQEVTVIGEVQFPTSHLYRKGFDVFDYIDISGGLSPKANDEFIYIIAANGEVKPVKKNLIMSKNTEVGAGDTVVVPYDTYAVGNMTSWLNVSQILFNLSTTAAALKTVGAF